MKFAVFGDVHAQLKLLASLIAMNPQVDYALQCGDLGVWKEEDFLNWGYIVDKSGHWDIYDTMAPFSDVESGALKFEKPLVIITGNHENFFYRDLINWEELKKEGVIWLSPNEPSFSIPNQPIRVGGLNGCFSYKVYIGKHQRSRKVNVKPMTPPHIEEYLNKVMGRDPRGRFTEKDIENVKKCKVDILLLHEPPIGLFSSGELPIKQKPGASPINDLIEEVQPRYAFVGHMHQWAEMTLGKTRVVALPSIEKGYAILDYSNFEIEKKETI